ncbi:MAG: L-2-amino-thiazoline-4-carboxylic acid hydrolase [Deltaproteobacteria bacterium]|nr:L-2-amino-thiazoline-4-carboxylic acid hydrolase [Deltaproteobacteria bacterium]
MRQPKPTNSSEWLVRLLKLVYRPLVRRAAGQALRGRWLDEQRPNLGRWLTSDVDAFVKSTWRRVDELLPRARLGELPTQGNRHNVFLAVVTTAAYQTLLERGVSRRYASTLVGDVGWKLYAWMLNVAALPARITTRDPYKRVERTLQALLLFPFSAPGAPGYEVEAWSEGDRFLTHWTHCPPHVFVRDLVKNQGDHGELDAFYHSWCLYDWPAADLLAGDGERGHYTRPHTMSRGDPVCDMCWLGRAPKAQQNEPGELDADS